MALGRKGSRGRPAMAARPASAASRLRPRLAVAGALLATGLLGWAVWTAQRTATSAPQFRVAALEVRGLRLLTGEEVLGRSGVAVGDCLFDVDLDAVAQRLDSLVWVRSARVERKPPDRLVVHLEERRRVAWIDWHARQYGLDADGVLLPPERLETEGIADLDLPILRVDGLGDSLTVGRAVADSSVARLLDWWTRARNAAPQLAADISQVEPYDDDALLLRMVADNLEVRMPYDRIDDRLRTLRDVLERIYGDGPDPVYVDLRFDGQAVVGRESSASVTDADRRAAPSRAGATKETGRLRNG